MKIQKIELRRFKSIREVVLPRSSGDQALGNLVILIGRNSSGKSNLLEAIDYFFREFDPALERAIGAPNPELWHGRETSAPIEWNITLKLEQTEIFDVLGKDFEVIFKGVANIDQVRILRRIIVTPQDMRWQTVELTLGSIDLVKEGKALTPEEIARGLKPTTLAETIQTELPQVLKPIPASLVQSILSSISVLLRAQFRYVGAARDNVQISPSFGNRSSIMNPTTLASINNLAQGAAPDVRKRWTHLRQKMERTLPNKERVDSKGGQLFLENDPLTATGGGAQSVLALVHDIEIAPSIVAIEEPENHLHPELIKKMLRYFQQISTDKGKQLFVTTHSPFFVDSSHLNNVISLYWNGQETTAQEIGTKQDLRTALFNIGARPSDIFFADLVLIVEGESDRIVLQNWSRILGVPLEDIHAAVIPARGVNKTRYHLKLWAEVAKEVGLSTYVFVDNDGKDEAAKVIDKGLVLQERTHVLEHGSVEDYYPTDLLIEALKSLFEVTVSETDVPIGTRVKVINKLLKKGAEEWKVPLAEEICKGTKREQIDTEIAAFLRQIYGENTR